MREVGTETRCNYAAGCASTDDDVVKSRGGECVSCHLASIADNNGVSQKKCPDVKSIYDSLLPLS